MGPVEGVGALSEEYLGLEEVYPSALRRGGVAYPATVAAWPDGGLEPPAVVELVAGSAAGELVRDDAHLKGRRSADPAMHDGPTLCWLSDEPGRLRVEPGGYFDMIASCGALRAEVGASSDWRDRGQNPLRAAVHDRVGDPLRSGAARSAAVGVSVVLTVPIAGGTERAMVIGQRPGRQPGVGGRWHVAPSGMLERDAGGGHLRTTVLRELAEELGIELDGTATRNRMTVLGLTQDLTMLRPDVVVCLDLNADEVPRPLRPVSEFTRLALVPLTPAGFAEFWRTHPPAGLIPHAAGAVALAEDAAALRP
jgi:hypothetical protein